MRERLVDATMSGQELLEIATNRALDEIRTHWPGHDVEFAGLRHTEGGGLEVTAKVTERNYASL